MCAKRSNVTLEHDGDCRLEQADKYATIFSPLEF